MKTCKMLRRAGGMLLRICAFTAVASASLVHGQSLPPDQVLSLKQAGSLPRPLQMHGSAVVGNRIYVMGGNGPGIQGQAIGGWSKQVISAKIEQDNTLGAWRNELELPDFRFYIGNSVEVVNNRIYIVGGSVAANQAVVESDATDAKDGVWTTVKSDGTLDPWRRMPEVPVEGLACAATCSDDRWLFVVGGLSNKSVNDGVFASQFAPDGAPGPWKKVSTLPIPLWFEGAAILEDHLFVWGGLPQEDNKCVNAKVYSAVVSRTGDIGIWEEQTPMPTPVYSSAFTGFNDHLLSIAGRYEGGYTTNVIWYSRFKDKRLGPWTMIKTDLRTRLYHSLGEDRTGGRIFVTGGRFRQGLDKGAPVNAVQAFHLPQSEETSQTAKADSSATGDFQLFIDEAIKQASTGKKQVLVYFCSSQVPACGRFIGKIASAPDFRQLTSSFTLAKVDLATDDLKSAYKYAVFKVPSLVLLNPDGSLAKKTTQLESIDDVRTFLAGAGK